MPATISKKYNKEVQTVLLFTVDIRYYEDVVILYFTVSWKCFGIPCRPYTAGERYSITGSVHTVA